jgi:two-component system, OmpR family, sensor kinase
MKTWWRRQPIRLRLAIFFATAGILLLSGFSATLYLYVRQVMARPLAHQLTEDIEQIRRRLDLAPDGSLRWDGRPLDAGKPWTTTYPWFEIWDEESQLIRRCWPFAENRVQQTPFAPAKGTETLSIFPVAADIRLRVLSVPFTPPGTDHAWTLRAMRIHQPAADALGALRWIIFIALPVVIVLLSVGAFILTRHWLAPLVDMSAEAQRITAENLNLRLPVTNEHDELGRLAAGFNVTLDRLEASFGALDRFVADASHELRTPLTTLRSVGEVALRKARTADEYRDVIASMLEEVQRLEQLVSRLLELATAEGGATPLHRVQLRVDDFVIACSQDFTLLAESRQQHLVLDLEPCASTVDPVLLRQALQNITENAIKYAPANSEIRIELRATDGGIDLSVIDRGPGISPGDQARLATRFFRPDRSRDRKSGGYGLGLSITKAYMKMVGGSLRYETIEPHGSRFTLRLPPGAPISSNGG